MRAMHRESLHNLRPAMRRVLSLAAFLVVANLLLWTALTGAVQAQTPTPPPAPRDALIQAIQQRGQHDVDMGKLPENVGGLEVLFGQIAAAVGMSMAEVANTYDAAYQAAKNARSRLEDLLRPNNGWLLAGILLVLLVLRDVTKDYLIRFFRWLAEAVYRQLAGYKLLWGIALRRYRKALERNHQELKVIFRPERPLQMQDVYVPLRVTRSGSREAMDAYQAIQKHKRLVVVGRPGAGKSMLLNHLTLTYARQGLKYLPVQPVPVLFQLNRLNDSAAPLIEHLVNVLERNNFPGGESFIKASLKRGQLLLLFDGLDEVNSQTRGRVVGQIKDLLQQYQNNRAVVTCRTQVYKDELNDWADQKLEITEFSDQQIQRFLSPWAPDMPEKKSIEHFLRTLRERPQIMALARNPLLLTMIAYLYTDTAFVLPHSRAEFYDRSTNLLLDQWKVDRNHYKVVQKRLVLQHLALFNQERARQAGGDRRSMDLPTVLAQVCAVLPSLTLKEEDAQPMLDEIVERSGLLLPVDGGARYQFTHLTLQEFFAAQALAAEPDKLLAYFTTDRDTWREVVRLWCGLEHDSTNLIRKGYQVEPVMAFECLGDAQQVETSYVAELVNTFKGRLAEAAGDESLARAFALVAADPRNRGEELFEFLKGALTAPTQRLAAAAVLALTNLPKAAEALAECARHEPDIRSYLTRMGDLSVPALEAWARQQQTWAMDALREVGTPQAALALVAMLWDDDATVTYQAAWRLAALLHRPNVELALRTISLTPEERKAKQINWIWAPFDEPPASALPVIAGRIAHLLHTASAKTIPSELPPVCDPRLAIPLCAVVAQYGQLEWIEWEARKKLISEAGQFFRPLSTEDSGPATSGQAAHDAFLTDHIDQISTHPTWRHLFGSLPSLAQFNLLCRLIQNDPIPIADDWRNVLRPSRYVFEASGQARGVKLFLALLGLLNLWGLVDIIRQQPQLLSWQNGPAILSGMVIVGVLWALGRSKLQLPKLEIFLSLMVWGVGPALGGIVWTLSGDWLLSIAVGVVGVGLGLGGLGGGVVDVDPVGINVGGVLGDVGFILVSVLSGIVGVVIGGVCFDIVGFGAGVGGGIVGFVIVVIGVVSFSRAANMEPVSDYVLLSVLLGAVGGIVDAIFMYLPTRLLYGPVGGTGTALSWMVYLVGLGFLIWYGKRQQRRAQNPLHGLLDEQGFAAARPYHLISLARRLRWYRQ